MSPDMKHCTANVESVMAGSCIGCFIAGVCTLAVLEAAFRLLFGG